MDRARSGSLRAPTPPSPALAVPWLASNTARRTTALSLDYRNKSFYRRDKLLTRAPTRAARGRDFQRLGVAPSAQAPQNARPNQGPCSSTTLPDRGGHAPDRRTARPLADSIIEPAREQAAMRNAVRANLPCLRPARPLVRQPRVIHRADAPAAVHRTPEPPACPQRPVLTCNPHEMVLSGPDPPDRGPGV